MTSLSYNIEGVGSVPVAVDTTTQAVSTAYLNAIDTFATIYNAPLGTAGPPAIPAQPLTVEMFTQAQAAYNSLISLAKNGLSVAGQSYPSVINLQMASNLDLLNKTFATTGLDTLFQQLPTSGLTTAQQAQALQGLQAWWDLAPAGLGNVINGALAAGASWESIQAQIELQFVQEGNNQISQALSGLQSALSATDSAVQFLTSLQNLYNEATPASISTISTNLYATIGLSTYQSIVTYEYYNTLFNQNQTRTEFSIFTIPTYTTPVTGENFVHQFISSGDAAFSGPIAVTASPSTASQQTFANMVSTQLPQLITNVMLATGYSQSDINLVLNSAQATPNANTVPPPPAYTLSVPAIDSVVPTSTTPNPLYNQWNGSLGQQLQTVLSNMVSTGPAGSPSLTNYIIDNQIPVTSATGTVGVNTAAGNYGRNLSAAEVAAQSINTQQQQQVQQELYVFQEFYQSASGMLTSLTQIIQNMAQAAGQ